MKITERDLMLFRKLCAYGMLSTAQIGKIVFNSIASTTVLRRLRLLEAGFYVGRVHGLESSEALWLPKEKAASMVGLKVPKRRWSKDMLDHDHKLLSLRLLLEKAGIADDWTPEHLLRSAANRKHGFREAKERLIPDGLMGTNVLGQNQSVAIELELNLKNFTCYRKKMSQYHATRGLYAVWYIAKDMTVINQAFRAWQETKSPYSSINFYGSILADVMKDTVKAKLMNGKPPVPIGSLWLPKGAQVPAQGVSGQNEETEKEKVILTAKDHTPIMENVS